MFEPSTLSFEIAKNVPTALVALVVGVIAAQIAYRQKTIAEAKVKLDLFDRRMEIFNQLGRSCRK